MTAWPKRLKNLESTNGRKQLRIKGGVGDF
jgi:hypothetical protein